MSEKLLDRAKVDRSAFSVVSLHEADAQDEAYWKSRTSDERFEALELSRQIGLWLRSDYPRTFKIF